MHTRSADQPEDFLPIHPSDLRIMLVLSKGPAHGYPIIKVIEERDSSWKRALPANLYRRLRDMRARGLVEDVEPPEGTPDDQRERRTLALTELGRRVAVAETRRLDTLVADAKRVLREV